MIDGCLLEGIANVVAGSPATLADIDLQNALRKQFDGLRIVVCSDDDIPVNIAPATGNARCNLYYLDANEHCVKLTQEAANATGLVVAIVVEEGHAG